MTNVEDAFFSFGNLFGGLLFLIVSFVFVYAVLVILAGRRNIASTSKDPDLEIQLLNVKAISRSTRVLLVTVCGVKFAVFESATAVVAKRLDVVRISDDPSIENKVE